MIHIDNYNEMHIETFIIIPLVVLLTFLNTMYSLNRVDKELKQLFKLKKTQQRKYNSNQKQDDEDRSDTITDIIK